MLWAEAPMIFPITAKMEQPVKNHLLPKISDSRPTRARPTEKPTVHDVASQMTLGEGPMASSMRESVLAGSTHPR